MKKKIEDVEYEIIPIPPSLSPYSAMISDLQNKSPKSVEEIADISKQIDAAMDKLLDRTVTPKPRREHRLQVYCELINLTNKILRDAGFFRNSKRPSSGKVGAIGAGAAQTTK